MSSVAECPGSADSATAATLASSAICSVNRPHHPMATGLKDEPPRAEGAELITRFDRQDKFDMAFAGLESVNNDKP